MHEDDELSAGPDWINYVSAAQIERRLNGPDQRQWRPLFVPDSSETAKRRAFHEAWGEQSDRWWAEHQRQIGKAHQARLREEARKRAARAREKRDRGEWMAA